MTGSKFKIIIYLVFIIIAIVFGTHVWRLVDDGFKVIDTEKKDFSCNNLNFQVVDKKFGASNITLFLISDSINFNITNAKISSDIENQEHLYLFEPVFLPGETRKLFLDEFYAENTANLVIDDCVEKGVVIKR